MLRALLQPLLIMVLPLQLTLLDPSRHFSFSLRIVFLVIKPIIIASHEDGRSKRKSYVDIHNESSNRGTLSNEREVILETAGFGRVVCGDGTAKNNTGVFVESGEHKVQRLASN